MKVRLLLLLLLECHQKSQDWVQGVCVQCVGAVRRLLVALAVVCPLQKGESFTHNSLRHNTLRFDVFWVKCDVFFWRTPKEGEE